MLQLKKSTGPERKRWLALAATLLIGGACGGAEAFPIDFGNPLLSTRLDLGVRYTAGLRASKIDDRIANDPNFDESDYRFKQGDLVTSRLDVLADFDLVYAEEYGLRVSGSAFYDPAYQSSKVRTNPGTYNYYFDQIPGVCSGSLTDQPFCNTATPYSALSNYFDNKYSSYTKRFYSGPHAELLDAFAFGSWEIGSTVVSVKAGQHAQFWGEGLFFPFYGIAYSQGPIDGLKSASNPGIQAKEVFLPTPQLSLSVLLTDDLSVSGQYYLHYKRSRFPEGGTFLGSADLLFDGPDRLFSGLVLPAGIACGAVLATGGTPPADCATASQPVFLDRVGHKNPGGESYGLMAKYSPKFISRTATVGLYFRHFTDTINYPTPQITQGAFSPERGGGLNSGTYRLVYAEGTEIYGLSYTNIVGRVSVASEASYRHRAALVNSGITADGKGPRGDMIFASANAVAVLPNLYIFPTGTFTGEVAWSHLLKVTEHEELFKFAEAGNPGCPSGEKLLGCATRNFYTAQIALTPQYPSLIPSTLLSLPITVNYGISGNNAGLGGGYEGALGASFGVAAKYKAKYDFQLSYITQHYATQGGLTSQGFYAGGNGGYSTNDRDWIAFTFGTTF